MKNILENNKVIAEFLSVKIHPCETIEKFKFLPIEERGLYNGYFIEDLKYHEDWNWLMEVVEKIESLPDEENNGAFFFEIYQDSVIIIFSNDNYIIDLINVMGQGSRINNVYQAVIKFIQLYNKANKSLS